MVPDELIPRCPHCGAEMFPWVRGYGNFLQGKNTKKNMRKSQNTFKRTKIEKFS